MVQNEQKLAENPLCPSGPLEFTKVSVNTQGPFIRYYTVSRAVIMEEFTLMLWYTMKHIICTEMQCEYLSVTNCHIVGGYLWSVYYSIYTMEFIDWFVGCVLLSTILPPNMHFIIAMLLCIHKSNCKFDLIADADGSIHSRRYPCLPPNISKNVLFCGHTFWGATNRNCL